MLRLINAENLVEYKASGVSDLTEWQKGWNDAIDTIMDETPTADAELVKHGHWVDDGGLYRCTACKKFNTMAGFARGWTRGQMLIENPYCPHCGAKMDESTMGQEKPSDMEFTLYADEKPIVTFKDSKIVLHGERKEDAKTN